MLKKWLSVINNLIKYVKKTQLPVHSKLCKYVIEIDLGLCNFKVREVTKVNFFIESDEWKVYHVNIKLQKLVYLNELRNRM